jgi:hypothetical protein
MKFSIILGAINLVELKRFRDDKFHLPTDYNARNARNKNENIINVTGDQHMNMIMDQMEKVQYDKYHKPNPGTNLDVSVNMFIDTIQGISESTMTYEITLFFRQFWIDPRLAWGKLDNGTTLKRADDTYNVAADMVDLIWVPDSFFIDEIDSRRHTIMTKNVFLEIHEDGHILLSERLSLKLKCPMHLRYYPFDLQICPIRIESYAFRDSQLKMQWHNTSQIQINEDIALPTFRLTEFLVRPECSREHTTAIDVWTVSCNIFVFLSLMEYAFAQVFLRMKQNDISRRRNSGDLHADAPEVMYWNGIGSGSEGIWVDKLSRKLFPMIYTVFNLLYWIICCTSGHIPYPSNVIRHPIELIEG